MIMVAQIACLPAIGGATLPQDLGTTDDPQFEGVLVRKDQNGETDITVRNDNTSTANYSTQARFCLWVAGVLVGHLKAVARNLGTGLTTPSLYLTSHGNYDIVFGFNNNLPSHAMWKSGDVGIGTLVPPSTGGGKSLVMGGTTDPTVAADQGAMWFKASDGKFYARNGTGSVVDLLGQKLAYEASERTASFTAVDNTVYRINLSGASADFLITLPSSLVVGSRMAFIISTPHGSGTYKLTWSGNGNNINGSGWSTTPIQISALGDVVIVQGIGGSVGYSATKTGVPT